MPQTVRSSIVREGSPGIGKILILWQKQTKTVSVMGFVTKLVSVILNYLE